MNGAMNVFDEDVDTASDDASDDAASKQTYHATAVNR